MRKIVFDIETSNIFSDVGKNDPALLNISIVAIYDSETNQYYSYLQEDFLTHLSFYLYSSKTLFSL